ncbi:PREDICTED: serine/threonine-protein phosphatase 4 regulatory subunit 4-like [Priapulus caudatus]|uniref:Serine/threonine-protein phosphatase 4 regulatory subunit 4-like n=1 Tax=Priapulus caudatus TaxID=37621 RepID=A0ABM1FA98_PRICU|nr:PREDICTED: serine/threonine-protein phosphatase 4 regulatory subunit 4-like [Priapulus caudatus]
MRPYLMERRGSSICEFLVDNSGQEVQRISVIDNLPSLLEENCNSCMKDVVPKVKEVLHMAPVEVQLAGCQSFLSILENEILPHTTYTQSFLQSILASVDSKDQVVANAWLETLLDVIDLLPKEVIQKDILNLAISKGQLSQPVQSRLSCCKILGKIATKFEPYLIKKEILPVVQSLCQDVDYEVRGCMCRQLDSVARGIGLEATKISILPELVELANDEESFVRLAGLEAVVSLLSLLDDDTCVHIIIPLVRKFCEMAMKAEDPTLAVVAKQLGKLCHGLSVNLSAEQRQWFLNYYRQLCQLGLTCTDSGIQVKQSPDKDHKTQTPDLSQLFEEADIYAECRLCAAFNFPAMVLFAGALDFKCSLYATFAALCEDPYPVVRRTVASGFHEVAKLLGSNVYLIQGELVILLKDESIEVLEGIIPHLPEMLECMVNRGRHSMSDTRFSPDLQRAGAASSNWRLHEQLLSVLACLPKCLSSDDIFCKFCALFFQKATVSRARPVRIAAVRTLCVYLRNNLRAEQRSEICKKLIEDFCRHASCHKRMLFIEICIVIIELFSKSFFKQFFYTQLLELHMDAVPNIRLRLCTLLPRLKSQLKLPTDRGLLQQLESCVRKLMVNEKDRDVTAAIRHAIMELDKIEVAMDTLSRRVFLEGDLEDQERENEEKHLVEIEERERKEEESRRIAERKTAAKAGKIPIRKPSKSILPVKEVKRTPSNNSFSSLSVSSAQRSISSNSRPKPQLAVKPQTGIPQPSSPRPVMRSSRSREVVAPVRKTSVSRIPSPAVLARRPLTGTPATSPTTEMPPQIGLSLQTMLKQKRLANGAAGGSGRSSPCGSPTVSGPVMGKPASQIPTMVRRPAPTKKS